MNEELSYVMLLVCFLCVLDGWMDGWIDGQVWTNFSAVVPQGECIPRTHSTVRCVCLFVSNSPGGQLFIHPGPFLHGWMCLVWGWTHKYNNSPPKREGERG